MEELQIEIHDAIAVLTINRPTVLNALDEDLLAGLLELLNKASSDQTWRALIVTGAGEKAFIAGADIKQMFEMRHDQMLSFCALGQKVSLALEEAPYVTIAAVNGYALGGGLEMALACDFIYADAKAKLGLPEVTLGILPGFGGTQRLARAIGTRQAKELVMSGKMITAQQAYELGLVNRVCETGSLLNECLETAKSIVKHSALAASQIKRVIDCGYNMNMHEAFELERNMCAVCFATPEREQGMQAFLNKKQK